MWLGKFIDFETDMEELKNAIGKKIFDNIKKYKLTPLEFSILENIFNYKEISGYDLITNLNTHFAGTWEAKSGTIYPILSRLEKGGFLRSKTVQSPIGPLKKVYGLTDAGKKIIKHKINKHFLEQINFIENFLVELSAIYVCTYKEKERNKITERVKKCLDDLVTNAKERIPEVLEPKSLCPYCKETIKRNKSNFCPNCGANIVKLQNSKEEIN
ncbi:MAG: helix-turn-helix transcriptional regulator [Candidatus Lokiarchaeota archaeon]